MFSLRYNRRLFWVALAAALWMCCGMLLALGAAQRPGEWPLVRFSLGLPEGGLWLPGVLRRVEEQPELLVLTLAVPPGAKRDLRGPHGEEGPKLPADLQLDFVDADPRQFGPPEVILLDGPQPPRELPGGRQIVLTSRYLVKFGRGGVRVIPRTPELTREKLKRWLQKEEEMQRRWPRPDGQPGWRQPGGPPPNGEFRGPPPNGPGQGPPPGAGPGPPPGEGQRPPPGERGRAKERFRWFWQNREPRALDGR